MRVLLITLDFPPFYGGVSNYLSNLCRHLPVKGLFVLTVLQPQSKLFDQNQPYKIFRRKLLAQRSLVWPKWIFLFLQSYKFIKQLKPDLLWAGQVLPVGTVTYLLAKWFKLPYIVTTYGMDIKGPLETSRRRVKLLKKIFCQARKVITISHYTQKLILSCRVPANKIKIVYPCADSNKLSAEVKIEVEQKFPKHKLLTVSRLVPRKGIDKVIRALPNVIKFIPDLTYYIIGTGDYEVRLKYLVKQYCLYNHVKFLGAQTDEAVKKYYQACDVFIMVPRAEPGDIEGFGLVYLEANAYGKPVIGSKIGGVPDAVIDGYSGILIGEPSNTDLIASQIVRLLTNQKLYNTLASQSLIHVKNFNWSQEANKLKKIIYGPV